MKVTFPHMGNLYVPAEALLNEMGHEVVVPPPCTKRTLDLGTKYSPETACLPLKIMIGNFLEAIELGAERIVMIGGCGPCRLGYYAEIQRQILADLGKEVEMITLEPPRENARSLFTQGKRLLAPRGISGFVRGSRLAWAKLIACEQLENAARWARPREPRFRLTTTLLRRAIQKLREAQSVKSVRRVSREWHDRIIGSVDQDSSYQPLRVGIVGEIYTVLEPFVSIQMEERLGHLGVEAYRTISVSEWIIDHIFKASVGWRYITSLEKTAVGFLRGFVGGHGLETVARTIDLADEGFDGVIQVLPFTCMPEIIAQSILPEVSQDKQIPVMTLVVDEHTGEAGFQTRLEAFVDLLNRRKGGIAHGEAERLSRG